MGFLIILAVIVLAIILMKKSTSDKNSSFEEPVKSQITFNDLSQEDLDDRDEKFRDLMQGRNGEELTKCYNRNLREVYLVCCQRGIVRKSLLK